MIAGRALPGGLSTSHRAFDWGAALVAAAGCTAATIVLSPYGLAFAAAISGGLAGGAWLLLTPRHDVALLFYGLYLGLLDGFLRLRTGNPNLTVLRDLLLLAVSLGWLLRLAVARVALRPPPLTSLVAGFAALAAVQVFNPGSGPLTRAVQAIRPDVAWLPLFFLGYAVLRDGRRIKALLVALVAIAVVNGVVEAVQFSITPEQLATWGPGYHDRIFGTSADSGRTFFDAAGLQRTRPFGLGADVAFGGNVGWLALPAAVVLLMGAARGRARALAAVALAGVVLAIVASQSRTPVIAGLMSLGVLTLLLARSRRIVGIMATLVVVGVVTLAVASGLSSSATSGVFDRYREIAPSRLAATTREQRGGSLALVPDYIRRFPAGAGLGLVGPATSLDAPGVAAGLDGENSLTFLLVEFGIPGLLLFLLIFARVGAAGFRAIRAARASPLQIHLAALVASFTTLGITGLIQPITVVAPNAPFFWLVAGIASRWFLARPATERLA